LDYLVYYLATSFMVAGVTGFVLGGAWVWLGASTFLLALALDLMFPRPDFATREIRHPALVSVPLYLHVPLAAALLVTAARRVHLGATGAEPLGAAGIAGCVATLAWLGVLPNIPVTHELTHRRGRVDRVFGFLLTLLIADPVARLSHVSAHHVHLALREDGDTARRGESIYEFLFRATIAGTREGFRAEASRLARRGCSVWSWRSEIVQALLFVPGALLLIAWLAGPLAAGVLAGGFAASRLLLEAFNYLQHYGLVRAPGTRYDRRHTWSHLTPVVRAIGFEITNHAHHHMSPQVPFYALEPDPTAPQMPSALVCFVVALVPPLWTRLIAMPRLKEWDERFATPVERELASAANRAAGWPDWLGSTGAPSAPPETAIG
jgi:toluene methyl-monooxygenase